MQNITGITDITARQDREDEEDQTCRLVFGRRWYREDVNMETGKVVKVDVLGAEEDIGTGNEPNDAPSTKCLDIPDGCIMTLSDVGPSRLVKLRVPFQTARYAYTHYILYTHTLIHSYTHTLKHSYTHYILYSHTLIHSYTHILYTIYYTLM